MVDTDNDADVPRLGKKRKKKKKNTWEQQTRGPKDRGSMPDVSREEGGGQQWGLVEHYKFPSGVWGWAPAEIEFGAFWP